MAVGGKGCHQHLGSSYEIVSLFNHELEKKNLVDTIYKWLRPTVPLIISDGMLFALGTQRLFRRAGRDVNGDRFRRGQDISLLGNATVWFANTVVFVLKYWNPTRLPAGFPSTNSSLIEIRNAKRSVDKWGKWPSCRMLLLLKLDPCKASPPELKQQKRAIQQIRCPLMPGN